MQQNGSACSTPKVLQVLKGAGLAETALFTIYCAELDELARIAGVELIQVSESRHEMKRLTLLLLTAIALAGGAGVGAMPMNGGAHGQGGSHHQGFVGHRGFVHHGFDHRIDQRFDHRFDGHHRHFRGSVFIAVPILAPPIYYAQPVYIEQYWYYCNDPAGYYPAVQNCPQGWQRVIPSSPPQ